MTTNKTMRMGNRMAVMPIIALVILAVTLAFQDGWWWTGVVDAFRPVTTASFSQNRVWAIRCERRGGLGNSKGRIVVGRSSRTSTSSTLLAASPSVNSISTQPSWDALTNKVLLQAPPGMERTSTSPSFSSITETVQSATQQIQRHLGGGMIWTTPDNNIGVSSTSVRSVINENVPTSPISLPKLDMIDFNFQLPNAPNLQMELEQIQQQLATIVQKGGLEGDGIRNIFATSPPFMDITTAIPSSSSSSSMLLFPHDHPYVTAGIIAWGTYGIIQGILQWGQPPPPSQPYPLGSYDPISAKQYFDTRKGRVVGRAMTVLVQSLWFAIQLLSDRLRGDIIWEKNQPLRGEQLASLLTHLGPTFIKVGQSLSIRSDLLPPAYIRGLASLQDQVPPFDGRIAQQIMETEWGVTNIGEVLVETELPARPIAAASLGQVYKVTLKGTDDDMDGGNTQVAVKVQRPDIITQIALDMHLLREVAPIVKRVFRLNTDTVGTVDAWGKGFVDELDYIQEARNAQYFLKQIQQTPLKDVVLAPAVVEEYTSRMCLMTEWVDGQRLDRSTKEDVTLLCSICMNTYLSMLLEMGILHCDPHPGNLLRTPEGKLAILDWGMVTSIPPQLQRTLIEHMAHLTSGDYAEVPRDLLLLGFVPEEKADAIEDSGVVDVLANIYGAWTSGGGLASINANDVLSQLQGLAGEKGNLFQIPPYFAYIAKSFSVLEGIGLSNDPKYSIINACLPYVSNRLLTDKDTMGNALNTFVFGPDKGNLDTRLVNSKRVEQLLTGFGSFTATVAVENVIVGDHDDAVAPLSRIELLESVADQLLDVLLTEEETPLQEIINDQLAKILAASTRTLWSEVRNRSGVLPTGRTVLGTLVDPLGIFQTSPLVNANDQDERTLEMTVKLVELLQSHLGSSGSGSGSGVGSGSGSSNIQMVVAGIDLSSLDREEVLTLSRFLVGKIWDRRVAVIRSTNRFWNMVLQQTASRLENGERVPVPDRKPTIGSLSSRGRRPLSSLTDANSSDDGSSSSSSNGGTSSLTETDRLVAARNLLGVFEREEFSDQ